MRDYKPDVAILADAGATLSALAKLIAKRNVPDAGRLAAVRAANLAEWPTLQRKHVRVLDALRVALPDDGIVASDMTQIAYTGCCHFICRRPRTWFHPLGFGTLGYALPAAIGAKIARPERAVVALAGDAGFLFTVQEIATAAELGLPIAILLWNNDALGQIAGDMVRLGIGEVGVKPRNPDFQALARAFHCHAVRPDSLAGLTRALQDAFTADRPTLIEVHESAPYLA